MYKKIDSISSGNNSSEFLQAGCIDMFESSLKSLLSSKISQIYLDDYYSTKNQIMNELTFID